MKRVFSLASLAVIALFSVSAQAEFDLTSFSVNDTYCVETARAVNQRARTFKLFCQNPEAGSDEYKALMPRDPSRRWWVYKNEFQKYYTSLSGQTAFPDARNLQLVPFSVKLSNERYYKIRKEGKRTSRRTNDQLGMMYSAVYTDNQTGTKLWLGVKYDLKGRVVAVFGRDLSTPAADLPAQFAAVKAVFNKYVLSEDKQDEYRLELLLEENTEGDIEASEIKRTAEYVGLNADSPKFFTGLEFSEMQVELHSLGSYPPYYCFNYKNYSGDLRAKLDQYGYPQTDADEKQYLQECREQTEAMINEMKAVVDQGKSKWSAVSGDYYGDYREVNVYLPAKGYDKHYLRVYFDIMHEI